MSEGTTKPEQKKKEKKPANRVMVRWDGDERFEGQRVGSNHKIRIDGTASTGPGPVDTLLCALAACIAIDATQILAKRRTPVEGLTIEVVGDRANAVPARLTKIVLAFRMRGEGIDRVHAERAIELAVTKYCSVRDSLDPSMPVEWTLDLQE